MQSNEAERRREPRRNQDRNATQSIGQQPQAVDAEQPGAENDTPSFFRAGEFAVRDPSLPERRSGEDKRKGARKIQMQPDSDSE